MKPNGFSLEREARRRLAVQRVNDGWSQKDVAQFLGVNRFSVAKWVRAYRAAGEEGLRLKPPHGRPPGLTNADLRDLERLLLQGATAHGWANDLWTCGRIREVIRRTFGIEYNTRYLSVFLRKRLGWTPQRPDQQNVGRDDTAIAAWVREAFPPIVAASAARRAAIVFVDEAGFMLEPTVRRTYAPRGQTPVHRVANPHARISAIAGISVRPGDVRARMLYGLLPDNVNFRWPSVVRFVHSLRSTLRRPITLVWDQTRIHNCPALSEVLAKDRGVVVEFLPPYAPELNPADGIWRYIKHGRLPNFVPPNLAVLREAVTCELDRLRRRPDLLRGFIRFTKLLV